MTILSIKSEDCHFKTFSDENKKDSLDIQQGIKELIKTKPIKRLQQKN